MFKDYKKVVRKLLVQIYATVFATMFAACTDYLPQVDAQIEEKKLAEKSSHYVDGSTYYVDPSTVVESTMVDSRDGKTYRTVTIGSQVWMAENLNYKTINSFCYNDKSANCVKYGRLYTWSAVMDSSGKWSASGKGCGYNEECSPTYPVQGVCPSGWHLPTRIEWRDFFAIVGGTNNAGKKLKASSGWNDGGDALDVYSFCSLPAGFRGEDEIFYDEGRLAYFWSSSENNSKGSYAVYLHYNKDESGEGPYNKYNGLSVRCVKNKE